MSLRFRVVFAGACAVLAVMLCAGYAQHVQGQADRVRSEAMQRYGGEVVSLVVARRPLEAGDVVGERDVEVREWLSDLAPDGSHAEVGEVVGRRLTSAVPSGSPVCDVQFQEDGAALEVPSGHVAVSLGVTDRLGLPQSAIAGTRLLAYRTHDGSAELVADDVEVLVMPSASTGILGSSDATVTLALLPGQVSDVLTANASGDLRLAMPAGDVDVQDVAGGSTQAPAEVPSVSGEGSEA